MFRNVVKEQLGQNKFRRCYDFFFLESIIPKVLDHNDVQSSLSTITKHLDNGMWKTPYNWRFYENGCQACTKTFNLLLYASLSLKQA